MSLRLLNYDDFLILALLLHQETLTSIAAKLKLTQPAITQRIRKLENAFDIKFFEKVGRHLQLTTEARAICLKAKAVLEILKSHDITASQAKTFTLGSRPGVAETWIWQAISNLRRHQPDLFIHLYIGSGDELIQKLGQGKVDAVVTSAPVTTKNFQAIEVAQENYLMVATPKVAAKIKKITDLEPLTLVEFDRSFPFLNYIDHKIRSKIKFAEVWFLQSTKLMVGAIADGHGVGIVPEYIAKPMLADGTLVPVKLKLDVAADYFRVIFNSNHPRSEEIALLAAELQTIPLF